MGQRHMKARLQRRNLVRDKRGMMMVEFALVGPMFLLLMLAIIEVGLLLFSQTLLDAGARDAARAVRTGQITNNAATAIQNIVCSDMSYVLSTTDCNSQVLLEMVDFGPYTTQTYTGLTFPSCSQNGTQGGGTPCVVNTGSPNDVIGVRLVYARKYLIPWVGACLTGGNCWTGLGSGGSGSGSGTTTLMSTLVFKNEP